MRLSKNEIKAIKSVVSTFDKNAEVYLYGSRIHESLKGGDIDLLVISDDIDFEQKLKLKLRLYDVLGEQKIDLLLSKKGTTDTFVNIALSEGIKL